MDCFGLEKVVDAKSTTSQVLGSTFISPKLKTEVCSNGGVQKKFYKLHFNIDPINLLT